MTGAINFYGSGGTNTLRFTKFRDADGLNEGFIYCTVTNFEVQPFMYMGGMPEPIAPDPP